MGRGSRTQAEDLLYGNPGPLPARLWPKLPPVTYLLRYTPLVGGILLEEECYPDLRTAYERAKNMFARWAEPLEALEEEHLIAIGRECRRYEQEIASLLLQDDDRIVEAFHRLIAREGELYFSAGPQSNTVRISIKNS